MSRRRSPPSAPSPDCKRETYLALQEIEGAYAGLTAEEQAEVTNYGTFLQQKQTFQTLLEAYRRAKLAELDAYYDKLKRTDYTTDQWTKITEAYRTGRSSISSAQYAEQADAALKQAKADIDAYVNGDTIEVSFRLIGDFPESYTGKHLGYVTWIETETYTVKKGSTVHDVFTEVPAGRRADQHRRSLRLRQKHHRPIHPRRLHAERVRQRRRLRLDVHRQRHARQLRPG